MKKKLQQNARKKDPRGRLGSAGKPKRLPARLQKFDQTIVLLGLMGAGKTTVGRRLAKVLGLPFVDSDHEIEAAANMTVSEIFESYGEDEFRSGERRVIKRLLEDGAPKVMATGGGAFLNGETRALIKDKALSVWLNVDVELLVERTSKRDTRPLLRGGDPREILTKLAEERYPIYAKADIAVESSKGMHTEVVSDIIDVLNEHMKQSEEEK